MRELEPLVGEWELEMVPPGGEPVGGAARSVFAWHESGALLVQRTTIDLPEAPDSVCVIGCDAANGAYSQLYTDERGVCRIYAMSIGGGEWRLWRDGEPFAQRFVGRFEDDGRTIRGRWEAAKTGGDLEIDFDLIYRKVG
ncbi:MAG: hypothetical protein JSU06_06290 [Actinobacteria bacterium]|nr:hypothetical protein [Actinomycetota bacterium]